MEDVCEGQHIKIQEAEAVQLMRDYLLYPEQHMLHPKRYSNSIINSIGEDKTLSSLRELSFSLRFCLQSLSLVLALIDISIRIWRSDANKQNHYMKRFYYIIDLWLQVMEMVATPPVDAFPLLQHVPKRLLDN